jgi:hypothetical protein
LTVDDGVVSVVGDPAKKISYADMIGGGFFHSQIGWNNQYGNPLALTSPAKPKTFDQYKLVGTSPPRFDVEGKVFGTTPWVQDIRVDGMLHGRMIRPPVAGATPVTIDESAIKDIPGAGVHAAPGVVAPMKWDGQGAETERCMVAKGRSTPDRRSFTTQPARSR